MVKCPGCGVFLEFGTDQIGRTVERCPRCGASSFTAQPRMPPTENGPPPAVAPPPNRLPEPARYREPTPTMAKIKRTYAPRVCQTCGKSFVPTGTKQRFCTPEHNIGAAPAKIAKKPEHPERPRTPAKTAFPSPRSTRSASVVDLSGAIAKIEEQLAGLDAQRERLLGAIESLREIEAA
jgi:hypothetical protein